MITVKIPSQEHYMDEGQAALFFEAMRHLRLGTIGIRPVRISYTLTGKETP